jgi:hypothetical protein
VTAFIALIVYWTSAALLGHASRRIGRLVAVAAAAVVILSLVLADFVIRTPDPWDELYHGGPGPLPIRLLDVFGPRLVGLAILAWIPMRLGRTWWPAATRRRRIVWMLATVAIAAAALVPNVRLVWTIENEIRLVSGHSQALLFVSSTDLGAQRSPASWAGFFGRVLLGSWESGAHDKLRHRTLFVIDDVAVRRLEIPEGSGPVAIAGDAVHLAGRQVSRWTGSGFAPLSDRERPQFEALRYGATGAPWTLHYISPAGDLIETPFAMNGVPHRLLVSRRERRTTIDVAPAQRAARTIWSIARSPRSVSREDYRRLFARRGGQP